MSMEQMNKRNNLLFIFYAQPHSVQVMWLLIQDIYIFK